MRQISPDKNMNFPRAIASFTLPVESPRLRYLALTRLQAKPQMMFLFVDSQFCSGLPFGYAQDRPSDIFSRICPCLSLVVYIIMMTEEILPQRTFTLSVHAHAGRTQHHQHGRAAEVLLHAGYGSVIHKRKKLKPGRFT